MTFVLADTLDDVLAAAMPRHFVTMRPGIEDSVEYAEPVVTERDTVAAVA
jgi:hypothetical protein